MPTEYSKGYDDGRAFAQSELARLERENAKLRNDLAEAKSELESINRRVAHVCASLS